MPVRGIRGATTAAQDSPEAILAATQELLEAIAAANRFSVDDVASAIFTSSPDLTSAYPAAAARHMGWDATALLGAVEIGKPGGVANCIRVLIHVNTDEPQTAIRHVYLRGARVLRPDLEGESR